MIDLAVSTWNNKSIWKVFLKFPNLEPRKNYFFIHSTTKIVSNMSPKLEEGEIGNESSKRKRPMEVDESAIASDKRTKTSDTSLCLLVG